MNRILRLSVFGHSDVTTSAQPAWLAGLLAFALLWAALSAADVLSADAVPVLDAPMQPIAKPKPKVKGAADEALVSLPAVPTASAREVRERGLDRSAPEFPGAGNGEQSGLTSVEALVDRTLDDVTDAAANLGVTTNSILRPESR